MESFYFRIYGKNLFQNIWKVCILGYMESIYFRINGKYLFQNVWKVFISGYMESIYFLSQFQVTVTTISIPVYKGKVKAVPVLAY